MRNFTGPISITSDVDDDDLGDDLTREFCDFKSMTGIARGDVYYDRVERGQAANPSPSRRCGTRNLCPKAVAG